MYLLKKFKHLDNNYMLVELNDKVKNNFLSSFLIGIDNKFLKLDTGDLNESTDYYKNKLNDKVMEKFDGKKFNKLNKKHLTYLADLCKMNLVIFDLDKLDLKFSTDLNKKNKTVYLFKHGKKEYLLMKQNMRGMVSKLPVGIYEQFGGNNTPLAKKQKVSHDDDFNRIEQINLVRLADTIYELNQIDIDNEINNLIDIINNDIDILDKLNEIHNPTVIPSSPRGSNNNKKYNILNNKTDNYDNITKDQEIYLNRYIQYYQNHINTKVFNNQQNGDKFQELIEYNKKNCFKLSNDDKNCVINGQRGGTNRYTPPYNDYEKSDYAHDFSSPRGDISLHRKFMSNYIGKRKKFGNGTSTYDKILNDYNKLNQISESKYDPLYNEEKIMKDLNLPNLRNTNTLQEDDYSNSNSTSKGKIYSVKITSLEEYKKIKHLPINQKIAAIFNNGYTKNEFTDLINKCKKIYGLIKENKCDYLQFDQGDTKKILLETPISPNSTIGLTRLHNLPTLIDGAGSSKIDTIIDNKYNNKNYTAIYNSIFHDQNNSLPLTFSKVDYNKVGNSSDGFIMNLNNDEKIITNGFTVDNLKEVMCHIDKNNNLNEPNEILNLVNTINSDDNDSKLQILRKLKFIGDRGQIVSAIKDNENNFTSRTLLGSGDRIFIAYALIQKQPIIFTNHGITRLYLPDILPDENYINQIKKELINTINIPDITKYDLSIEGYANKIFKAFLTKEWENIKIGVEFELTNQSNEIIITSEEKIDIILSSIIEHISYNKQDNNSYEYFKEEIMNVNTRALHDKLNNNNNNNNIKDVILDIIQQTTNIKKNSKKMFEKINNLFRVTANKMCFGRGVTPELSYNLVKYETIKESILTGENKDNINDGLLKLINKNIQELKNFKQEKKSLIIKINAYKKVTLDLLKKRSKPTIDATRIMNEIILMDYIKTQPENK